MSLAILGIGTAVPPISISQDDAAQVAVWMCCRKPEDRTWLPVMYQQTGIRKRHVSFDPPVVQDLLEYTRHTDSPWLPTGSDTDFGPSSGYRMSEYAKRAPELALSAARQVLERTGRAVREITHLVTVSCTGFVAPGNDIQLMTHLGLRPTTQRVHVGFMGCHGAINGLRVAHGLAATSPKACVLLSATELCSLHYHYNWEPQKMIANALFADGSAALLAVPDERLPWRVKATASCLIPESQEAMSWTIGDHGYEMTLSRSVPGLIRQHLRPWLSGWLEEFGLRINEIGSWAIHPGGPKILEAVEQALELPAEATADARAVFAEYGNMSSPTVLFILDRLMQRQAARPCLMLGFGPGLMAEAALLF